MVFNPGSISVTRYRYRGARIPNPQGIPASVDPSSLRVYCASREERQPRGTALARGRPTGTGMNQPARCAHGEPDAVEVVR